jgi:hypothetical protein
VNRRPSLDDKPSYSLKIIEGPIRYVGRTYGKTQISRFRHGLLLLRMVCLRFCASKRLKLDAIIHPPERILESSHQPETPPASSPG